LHQGSPEAAGVPRRPNRSHLRDFRVGHDLGPFSDIVGDTLLEAFGRGRPRVAAELAQPFNHRRLGQDAFTSALIRLTNGPASLPAKPVAPRHRQQ
jgi:hypothetical protein